MLSKKIVVSGRVQGVFFRESARQLAEQLSLCGGVRNLRNGQVEVLVYGDDDNVEKLINWLKTGPKLAKVSTIEVVEIPPDAPSSQQTTGFEVWATK